MYLRYYHLREKPFNLAHDPAYYYPAVHQLPLDELCYSIEERQGLATLIGEPGTGKTTLLRRLLQSLSRHQRGIFMSDASLGNRSLIHQVDAAVRSLFPRTHQSASEPLQTLLMRESDKTIVILVDEAQGLNAQQFEEIRHLTNLEIPGRKLLEIILAGQPSLQQILDSSNNSALDQRVIVRCRLEPFDFQHTRAYIEHRLRVAGAFDPSMFKSDAIKIIHEKSRGVPRLINVICERSLIIGYVDEAANIDAGRVIQAVNDLRFDERQATPVATEPMADGLMVRMGTRIETMEYKLEVLIQLLARAGVIHPELADKVGTRRWLERLREPSNQNDPQDPTNN